MRKEERIEIGSAAVMSHLLGIYDENIDVLSKETETSIITMGNDLVISGEEDAVALCVKAVNGILQLIAKGERPKAQQVRAVLELVREGSEDKMSDLSNVVAVTFKGKPIKCKTSGQRKYINAIDKTDLVICVGPAGTGKTYLSVAKAVMAYKSKAVERIILTRPAVEAGEKLGFLPGDLQNKVDPYLRPVYDALQDMLGYENYQKLMERGVIEVAPLAYMRGRTLNNAFIILDEAQNTTVEQMKMFLTRMGEGSKVIVNGDSTQIDLPAHTRSGLLNALDVLKEVEGVSIIRLSGKDIVRHDLVQRIVNAYDKFGKNETRRNDG